jgi:hypothetical protein
MSSQGTLLQQESGPIQPLEKLGASGIGLVKTPDSVHVQLEGRMNTARTSSNADTLTAFPVHPSWNV